MRAKKFSRRDVLRMSVGGAIGLVTVSAGGCQQSTTVPTVAPKATATTMSMAAPTATTASTARRLRYVAPFEIDTLDPKDTTEWQGGIFDVYETLTYLNSETGELEPRLAESWEQLEPNVWRFKLREGVAFSNGEPFNAEAVQVSVARITAPEAVNRSYMGELAEARLVDEHTVDLVTGQPDPILPKRTIFLFIAAPNWVQSAAPEEIAVNAIGTGPLTLSEWKKGQYILLKENTAYWGPNKARVVLYPKTCTSR
jgi:peptide/nickel transport system substrate-binding protein